MRNIKLKSKIDESKVILNSSINKSLLEEAILNKKAKYSNNKNFFKLSESVINHYLNTIKLRNIKCRNILNCWLLSENINNLPYKLNDKCANCIVYEKLWY